MLINELAWYIGANQNWIVMSLPLQSALALKTVDGEILPGGEPQVVHLESILFCKVGQDKNIHGLTGCDDGLAVLLGPGRSKTGRLDWRIWGKGM